MIHKEGIQTLTVSFFFFVVLNLFVYVFFPVALPFILIASIGIYLFLMSFFRNPNRKIAQSAENTIYAPADGRVVVIEEISDDPYLQRKAIQVSIFMSPLNVHVNRNPVSGKVLHSQHHPGLFLPAWNPKASTENERTTIAYESQGKVLVMRQIAGAMAKRIVNYLKTGDEVKQGEDMGFIKFGSRVDLLLPPGTEILVQLEQKVQGNVTPVARW